VLKSPRNDIGKPTACRNKICRWKESSVRATRRIAWLLSFACVFASSASFAQQAPPPHAPQISSALISGDELMSDLKYLTELAGPNGVKGWKLLKQILESFAQGVDLTKPIVQDGLLSKDSYDLRYHFPLIPPPPGKKLGFQFIANLAGVDVKVGRQLAPGLNQVSGTFLGLIRIHNGHASFAEKLGHLPANMQNPAIAIAPLLAKKFDFGLMIKNEKVDAADCKARRADFQKAKDEMLAGLKPDAGESSVDFDLRKALLQYQLAEAERFIAESKLLMLGWTTDVPQKQGRLDLELSAILKSSLDVSANLLGQTPSMFSSVPRANDAILSGRLNFVLDQLRNDNAAGMLPLLRASRAKRISTSQHSAEKETAMKKASDLAIDMLTDGAKAGVIDGMIEVTQAAGEKVNVVFGVKTVNGIRARDIVELIPLISSNWKVQLDAEAIGDVKIHVVTPEKVEEIELPIGPAMPIYVGSSENAIWIACGSKSLDQLKAAIGVAGKGDDKAKSTFFSLFGKVGPWIKLLDERQTRLDGAAPAKTLTTEETAATKKRGEHRRLAIEAFTAGQDTFEIKLDAVAGKVTGSTRLDEGILRFIGAEIAKFSNEKLK
jgi:hypothetical protein